jgi:hypothetical protein
MGQSAKEGDKRLGNSFWERRATHGRDTAYTPETLEKTALEYFQWVRDNPWIKLEPIRSGDKAGELIEVPTERPMTKTGFCIFAGISRDTFNNYCSNKENYKDFFDISTRICEVIRNNKFEGAVVKAFDGSIIARDLGLADKKEIAANTTIVWNEEKTYDTDKETDAGS